METLRQDLENENLDPKREHRQELRKRITNARTRLRLTQREMAELLNTSMYALARWERGDIEPSTDALERINALLHEGKRDSVPDQNRASRVFFPSAGIRARSTFYPLLDRVDVRLLEMPREDPLCELFDKPFWADGNLALAEIFDQSTQPAATRDEAFIDSISAGKNTYTYDAHTYHTKVPPQGIANVIDAYLPNGGVVLDPFAGSGMTGVAARYLGCDVILNELSPAACFIAHGFTRTISVNDFNSAIEQLLITLRRLRKSIYATECRECGADVEILYTVWSYSLECNHCHQPFVVWDHCRKYGENVREHKLLRRFPCPNCGVEVTKSNLKRLDQTPVFLGYRCCSGHKIVEHKLTDADHERIEKTRLMLSEYVGDYPDTALPDGVNLNQPKRHGLDTVAKFYSNRNLLACAAIWREIRRIEDPELSAAVGFVFTSLYQRVTRLSEYRFWGGSGNMANFNVPHIFNEANVFVTFERKAKSVADHYCATAMGYEGRCAIRTGSATDLSFLPDNSVDLIFTDPPFGANINYSEMNILWESWLGHFTDAEAEAIVNRAHGKGVPEYEHLMTRSLVEAYRVLRPGHWMVLVFMNSSQEVWAALRNAIEKSGFAVDRVGIFDKQHGTFKQFVSANAAGADLMIHCRKPKLDGGGAERVVRVSQAEVDERLLTFLWNESKAVPLTPFLHVERAEEVDYRTLYSRYIANEMRAGAPIVGFAEFRRVARRVVEDGE